MSTPDVPGYNPSNGDKLHVGCWAETKDKSLIFVKGIEHDRVVYELYDLNQNPILRYQHAMSTADFEKEYSFSAGKSGIKWTWHDKSEFPWDRVIKAGLPEGFEYASAVDQLSAAAKVAQSLGLKAENFNVDSVAHLSTRRVRKIGKLMDRISQILG